MGGTVFCIDGSGGLARVCHCDLRLFNTRAGPQWLALGWLAAELKPPRD
jgi:hypothetical protein